MKLFTQSYTWELKILSQGATVKVCPRSLYNTSKIILPFVWHRKMSLIVTSVQQIRSSIHARLVSLMAQILSCFWRLSTAECYWSPHKWHLKRKRNPCEVSAVFASLRDWLRKLSHVHSLQPIRVKELICWPIRSKPSRDFSRTCYRLHAFALKSDWFTM